jgi:hypothetical protein
MAAATSKTTALTNIQGNTKVDAKLLNATVRMSQDIHAYTASPDQLEAGDDLITGITLPSNAVVLQIDLYNDDLDSNGTPTLTFDIGLWAGADFTDVTSGSATKHNEDDELDVDLFVDGSTTPQAATTSWTQQALDATTFGPDDANKALWELLGYDEDPHTVFRVGITCAAAAATAAAGDVALRVYWTNGS